MSPGVKEFFNILVIPGYSIDTSVVGLKCSVKPFVCTISIYSNTRINTTQTNTNNNTASAVCEMNPLLEEVIIPYSVYPVLRSSHPHTTYTLY